MDWAGKSQFSNERTLCAATGKRKNEMKLIKLAFICQFLHGERKKERLSGGAIIKSKELPIAFRPLSVDVCLCGGEFPFGK